MNQIPFRGRGSGRTRWTVRLLLLVLPTLVGCGGGAANRDPVPQTVVLAADGDFTGFITELTIGLVYVTTANAKVQVGDDVANNQVRGFVRFDLSGLPAGATIQDATLRLTQEAPTGTPYVDLLTNLQVDHVALGPTLEGQADFSGNALGLAIGAISSDAALGAKTLGVAQRVALDLAQGRTTSDFRFAFPIPTDNNGDVDQAIFTEAGLLAGPTLELDLLVPPP